ncbi:acetyltransferase [Candidatus Omnitrophota bacterium]
MIYIFGAGRQGRIVYSILSTQARKNVVCYFIDDFKKGKCFGKTIKKSSKVTLSKNDRKVLALGNDLYTKYKKKVSIANRLESLPGTFIPLIGGFISWDVKIPNTLITHPGSTIMTGTKIGKFVIVSTNASIDHDNVIGDFVTIAPGVTTGGDVIIGEGSFIGMGAIILPGVKIGARCIIGAASLVRHDIPSGTLAYGVPAKTIKKAQK